MHRLRALSIALTVTAAGGTLAALPTATPAAHAEPGPQESVVVRTNGGMVDGVEAFVRSQGGTVTRELRIIDGFAATLPASARAEVAALPAVVSISDDAPMRPLATNYNALLGYDPTSDTGSMYEIARITNATAMWNKGFTGKGVGIAVIDTGVSQVPGLDGGQVVDGPDLSFDGQNANLQRLDGFGHGTLMASIIGGNDTPSCGPLPIAARSAGSVTNNGTPAPPSAATQAPTEKQCRQAFQDPANFTGIAPGARIVNVKVGAADGAADVSQVIAGIDWVVQHRNDAGLNIRVVNLSYGTTSLQPYTVDPLAFAAEVAWKYGIVVVAAAGNDGQASMQSLADPAYSPNIIAVGADDPMGTESIADDVVPDWASHGTIDRPVDVIAPGAHVVGLRVPGSYVDTYLSPGATGTRFQRGSGTSEATAVVSGLVALMLQQTPTATPLQIRTRLWAGASKLDTSDVNVNLGRYTAYPRAQAIYYMGAGLANPAPGDVNKSVPGYVLKALSSRPWSTGTGSLELSRGHDPHVADDTGTIVQGEVDIFGNAFNSTAMAALEANASSWDGGRWNGAQWSGSRWSTVQPLGSRWSSIAWDGTKWASSRWSGSRWDSMVWDGSRWSTGSFTGSRWDAMRWNGTKWAGSRWDGSRWSGSRWG